MPYLPLLPDFQKPTTDETDRGSELDEDEEFDDEARPHAEDVCEESEPGPEASPAPSYFNFLDDDH